jgi:hypothetical protein
MLIPCPYGTLKMVLKQITFSDEASFFFAIYLEKNITLFTSLYYICFIVCFLTKYDDHKTYVTQFFSAFPFPNSVLWRTVVVEVVF